MRVNVYGEEVTDRVEIVQKTVDQKSYFGLRLFCKSHPDLNHSPSPEFSDETAVTFWFSQTRPDEIKAFRMSLIKAGNAIDTLLSDVF